MLRAMPRLQPADSLCRRGRVLLVASALTALGGVAQAQPAPTADEPEPIFVAVDPAVRCVTAQDFFRLVRRRTPRARAAEPGEPGRHFRLAIEGDDRVVGRLLAEEEAGTTPLREVEGASCEEVADALALVLAVTLDPLAQQGPAASEEPVRERPQTRPSPGSPVPPPPVHAERAPPGRGSARSWEHAFGGEATLAVGLVEKPMVGLGARYSASLAASGAAGLLLTAGAFATFANDAAAKYAGDGVVRYHLQALSAGACPLGFGTRARVRLYPCASLTVGRLEARGIALPGRQSDSALFVAAALEGRVLLRLVGPLTLAGAAALSVPLQRYPALVSGAGQPVGGTNPAGFFSELGLALSTR